MFTVAICEDDIYTRMAIARRAESLLSERGLDFSIHPFSSAEAFLEAGDSFDLAIMDIQMKGMDGMSAAREMQARGGNTRFLFVTSYPDYVFDSFDVEVVSYLLKPLDDGAFRDALGKALRAAGAVNDGSSGDIVVKSGGAYHKLRLEEILYCESIGHKVRITARHGAVEYYGSIESLQAELGERFFRPHRAFLVNPEHVRGRDRNGVSMTDGTTIPLSRRKQQEFATALLRHLKRDSI